jgi:protein-disulfide isomerase
MRRVSTILVALLACASAAGAQTAADEQMKKDIEALKDGQKAIQRDLDEIKRLLQGARPVADALPRDPVSIADQPSKGEPKATVALIEFSDYQCPFCGRYTKDTWPQIESEYVSTGKIKYVFRDMPLEFHKNAFKAAEASHCAGEQGKYWEMHALLFENQAALAPEQLGGYAKSLGLKEAAFQQCLDSGKFAAEIRKDMADASTAGITGTPSFLVGIVQPDGRVKIARKLVGAKPYAEFKAAFDSLLAAPPAAAPRSPGGSLP